MIIIPTTMDQMTTFLPQSLIPEEDLHLLTSMVILLWNCREAGNFKDKVSTQKPNLVTLTKTKITNDKANDIIPKLGFTNSVFQPSEGAPGGILVVWNDELDLDLVGKTRQEIHIRVKVSNHTIFSLSAIYCLCHASVRTSL